MKKKYIERQISDYVKKVAGMYPVVTICGPRQSGKTTLARHLFPTYDYVSMEDPGRRLQFENDPRGFLALHPAPCIIDEVQNTPSLLSYLQGIVDEQNTPGMYILTGSRQMELQESITQSLAGRSAMVDLLPLSCAELTAADIRHTRDEALYYGGLPRLYTEGIPPEIAYSNYMRTYVERDVRQLINIKNLSAFETFIRLLAARVGQIINYSSLASDVGVSAPTIKEWVSMLEASYLIFTVHPYYNNFGKRLTKSPKIFFTETGLVTALLDINSPSQVARDPLIGSIYENLIVSEFLKTRLNAGLRPNLYFYRDAHGFEIDLILDIKRRPLPIEIKSAMTYTPALTKNLQQFYQNTATQALTPALVYSGENLGVFQGVKVININSVPEVALSEL
ncbi:MAG: ATP-binding protein [Akkermansia sp.]|nr:ATP-binding protein [Akkermansia sp.]MBQ4635663.1 ATP-binding protein [Akkermansia sp.]